MKAYQAYKSSGVEWLGEVPEHWEIKKITHIFKKIGSGTTPTASEASYYDNGEINWLQTGDLNDGIINKTNKKITLKAMQDFSSLKVYSPNSLVIAMYGATIGKVGLLNIHSTTNQACCVLSDGKNIEIKYIFYFFRSFKEKIISMAQGGGQPNINQDLIRSLRIIFPPLSEQQKIVQFLDTKTAQIDALIDEQNRLIALLQEQRKAVISHAVTKGINPTSPMKPSGVEWLGEVPSGWEIIPSKFYFTERKEKAEIGDKQLTASQRMGIVFQEDFISEQGRVMTVMKNPEILKKVRKSDFVISMRSFQGGLEFSTLEGSISSAYVMLIPNPQYINNQYFKFLFKSANYIKALQATSNLIRDGQALRFNNFSQVHLPLPPLNEQQEIADYIEAQTAQIDALITEQKNLIDRLNEYRTALMSAAVTGKIDVQAA